MPIAAMAAIGAWRDSMLPAAPYGLTELCPAIGSGAAPKGHGGPKVCALADQGAMAALRGRGAEKRWIDA